MKRGTVASPAQIVLSQGVAPKLDPHQAIGAGSPLCCLVLGDRHGARWRGTFLFIVPVAKKGAALIRRPLSSSCITETLPRLG
jgi:hypothetical protein